MSKIISLLCVFALMASVTNALPNSVSATINSVIMNSTICTTTACSVLRLNGATTNIATTPTVTTSGSYHIFTWAGLSSGSYVASDDSGTTFAAAVNTTCLTPDLPLTTIDFPNSGTYTNGTLRLKIRFLENARYWTTTYRYAGNGGRNCNSSATSSSYYFLMNQPTGYGNCTSTATYYDTDFNFALINCGYVRDETDPNNTVFSSNIIITTTDGNTFLRGAQIIRTLDTGVNIKIAFQTNITTTVSTYVFGGAITYSQLIGQYWNAATTTATLVIYSQVQWPYRLINPVIAASGYNATSWNAPGVAAQNPSCSGTNNGAQTYGDICGQTWNVTISRNAVCGSYLTLTGFWMMNFTVDCSPLYNGSNCTGNSGVAYVTFNTDSTNYCPQLIGTSSAGTAVLSAYQDAAHATAQSQYVFGTYTYFAAVITSTIKMDRATAEYIWCTAGCTVTASTSLYQRPFTSSPTYWNTPPTPTWGSYASTSFSDTATTNLQVTDSSSAGSFTQTVYFQIRWNSIISAAVGDSPISTTLQIQLRVRFTNQSTSAVPLVLTFNHDSQRVHVLDNTGSLTGSNTVGVSQSATVPTDNTATAAPAATDMSMMVGVIGGSVAGVALISGLAVVLLRRRRGGKEQVATVELSTSSNA